MNEQRLVDIVNHLVNEGHYFCETSDVLGNVESGPYVTETKGFRSGQVKVYRTSGGTIYLGWGKGEIGYQTIPVNSRAYRLVATAIEMIKQEEIIRLQLDGEYRAEQRDSHGLEGFIPELTDEEWDQA